MITWIVLVVVAQFLNAVVALIDKFIVTSNKVSRPLVYAFYISLLSSLAIIVFLLGDVRIPFGNLVMPSLENVSFPTLAVFGISILSGLTFLGALITLFSGLKRADASDVIPVVGAASAIATFILSHLFLDAELTRGFLWGFILLVAGTLVVSHYCFGRKTLMLSILSGIFFAAHFVCLKGLFTLTHFDNGFFWSRVGIVIVALSMLLIPALYKRIMFQSNKAVRRGGAWVLGSKFIAGVASLLILKATELGDVSIVQALGGLQFVFLLFFSATLGRVTPKECGENQNDRGLLHKLVAVTLIVVGLFVLFV